MIGKVSPAPDPSRPLWANRSFVRLWAGQVISTTGSGVSRLALPLLVLALTQSPVQAGLVGAAQTAPFLVLGLPAGLLVDRWNRKALMIVCDLVRSVAFVSVPLAWALGSLTLTHLYAVAFVHGTAMVFFNIAQLAALPRVVPTAQLAQAHSLNTASEGVASLVSPSLGGLIVSFGPTVVAGAALAYLLDGISYLLSALAVGSIRVPFQTPRPAGPSGELGRQLAEGLRYLWVRRDLRLLATVNMLHRMCFAPVQLAVVVLATQAFRGDARTVGLLFSAAGAGGLLASAITPWLRARLPVGQIMLGIVAVHAAGLSLVALAPSPAVAMAGMFAGGMMEVMTGIVQVSYRLAVIPDALQGRVHSSYRLLSFSTVTLGTAAGGVLLAALGPRAVLWALAAAMAAIALGIAASDVRRLS